MLIYFLWIYKPYKVTLLTLQPTLSDSYLTLTHTTSPVRHQYIYLVWSCALARWSSGKKWWRQLFIGSVQCSDQAHSYVQLHKRNSGVWMNDETTYEVRTAFLDERVYCEFMDCVVVTWECIITAVRSEHGRVMLIDDGICGKRFIRKPRMELL